MRVVCIGIAVAVGGVVGCGAHVVDGDADAGVVVEDAGVVVEDAGVVVEDAGVIVEDAGVIVEDAGVIVEDAGVIVEDAGVVLREPPAPSTIAGALTVPLTAAPFLTLPSVLPPALRSRFSIGRELFVADWVPAGGQEIVDGLGPLFNASSCLACHPSDRRASSHLQGGDVDKGLLIRLGVNDGAGFRGDVGLGHQLQPLSITGAGEGRVTTTTTTASSTYAAVSLTSPRLSFVLTQLALPLEAGAAPGGRVSPVLLGVGLLDRINDADLLARADPDDDDDDGISGRVHRLADGRLGRFGHKALAASTTAQTEAAFANDLGISTPTRSIDCTSAQPACLQAPTGGSPEIDAAGVDAVVTFLSHLGVPAARREVGDPAMARGAALFHAVGCVRCHVETQVTPAGDDALLDGVTFHPYTDLLLHDLGPDLADIGEGDAEPAEWRTPPLWGVGLVEAASPQSSRFLHDGRATTLHDAIRWHGGEADAARVNYEALDDDDQALLLLFLRSL